jgi:hypothetical protein
MESVAVILVALIAVFLFGRFWQKTQQDDEREFINNVRRGMEYELKDQEKIEELRSSEFFKYEYLKDFHRAYIVKSIAKELDLAPRVAAESIILGRFLGRSDDESIQLLRRRVQEYRAAHNSN